VASAQATFRANLGPERKAHFVVGNGLFDLGNGAPAAVGFDLYTKLLAEQVELLKARHDGSAALPIERPWPSLDLPLNAFIPPEYVRTLRSARAAIGSRQEKAGLSSSSTVQAPHWPSPQPNLAPLRPRSLRRA